MRWARVHLLPLLDLMEILGETMVSLPLWMMRLCEIQREMLVMGLPDTWDEMLVGMPGAPATDETELGRRVTDLVTTVRQDTDEIYGRLDDAQTELQMVTNRVYMLFRDRRTHARTARLIEIKGMMSREAWGRSMYASELACTKVMALRTQVVAQQSEITKLRAADRRRQTQLIEALKLMKTIQTQLTALRSRQGPARGPAKARCIKKRAAGSSSRILLWLAIFKMAPKRATRSTPAATTATTSVTNAQLQAMIDQGVTPALAARDAIRSTNGEDSHNSGMGVRRNE
ncbi:hypothetical protein Tco_0556293 [Tanacetum coccineum]